MSVFAAFVGPAGANRSQYYLVLYVHYLTITCCMTFSFVLLWRRWWGEELFSFSGWVRDLFVFANLDDILIGQRLVGFVVLGVLEQHLVHVGGGILVEPVGAAEDDESDLAIAQHRQFVGFFHDAEFALIERHLLFFNWVVCFSIPLRMRAEKKNEWIAYGKRTEIDSENSKAKKEEQLGNRPVICSRRRLLTD